MNFSGWYQKYTQDGKYFIAVYIYIYIYIEIHQNWSWHHLTTQFFFIRTEMNVTYNCQWIVYLCCPLLKRFFWTIILHILATFDLPTPSTVIKHEFPYFLKNNTGVLSTIHMCVIKPRCCLKKRYLPILHACCVLLTKLLKYWIFVTSWINFLGISYVKMLLLCWQYHISTFQLLKCVLWARSELWCIAITYIYIFFFPLPLSENRLHT